MVTTIIILTSIISVFALSNSTIMSKLQFNAYQIVQRKEWYRIFSHALIHGSWMHLIINMIALYSFGGFVIEVFGIVFKTVPPSLLFLFFYIAATAIASLSSIKKHKNDIYYNAVGASGAVSAVVFTAIFFEPYQKILFFGIVPIPGIIFGILYLGYSYYMAKRGGDNIGHDAHFYGAIFGLIFPVIMKPELILYFVNKLLNI